MTEQDTERAYRHWLYQAAGVGSRKFLRRLEQLGSAQTVYDLARREILEEQVPAGYRQKAQALQALAKRCDVMGEYEEMTARGIFFVTPREAGYPKKLLSISDAPYMLYYAGRLPDQEKKSIAVIGARSCSEYGRAMAGEFGRALAYAGVQVVSGMARGIDGISQRAALAAGGYSLGVFGCGVDVCYPEENRELYERLLTAGGVCSEYPPGTGPRAMLFPPRNRIISGLCDGVLVIEAKERSGTLITVDMALEQGREVYALPGRATDPLSAGCNRLIRQGAGLVMTPQELLEELQTCPGGAVGEDFAQQSLFLPEDTQDKVLRLLDFQPKPLSLIQETYGTAYGEPIAVARLCQELLRLCAAGYAGQTAGSYYRKSSQG